MNKTPELKPCPFCNEEMLDLPHHDFKHPILLVDRDCPLNGKRFDHSQRELWNQCAIAEQQVREAVLEEIARMVELPISGKGVYPSQIAAGIRSMKGAPDE